MSVLKIFKLKQIIKIGQKTYTHTCTKPNNFLTVFMFIKKVEVLADTWRTEFFLHEFRINGLSC